jgi:hypothetical protein
MLQNEKAGGRLPYPAPNIFHAGDGLEGIAGTLHDPIRMYIKNNGCTKR